MGDIPSFSFDSRFDHRVCLRSSALYLKGAAVNSRIESKPILALSAPSHELEFTRLFLYFLLTLFSGLVLQQQFSKKFSKPSVVSTAVEGLAYEVQVPAGLKAGQMFVAQIPSKGQMLVQVRLLCV